MPLGCFHQAVDNGTGFRALSQFFVYHKLPDSIRLREGIERDDIVERVENDIAYTI